MTKKGKPEKTRSSTSPDMSENWKTVLLQGAIALIIGIIILAVPDLSAKVVRYLLGGFLVVFGILAFVSAHGLSEEESKVGPYGKAVISFAGGLVVLFWYGLTALSLLYILAVFAMVAGVIVGGMGLLQSWDSSYKAISAIGGLLSIVFGVLLVANASRWSGSIIWIAGLYSLLLGLLLICLGLGARAAAKAGRPAS
jgi:uncharacterized membrane protein HdeD (DUF308 family)